MGERFISSQEKVKVAEVAKDLLVANLADEIGKKGILKPRDDVEKRKANGEAVRITAGFGLGADSVKGLRDKMTSGSDGEKRQADEALDRLGKAVFLAMSADEDLTDIIPLGAVKVDEVLPPVWKTLGEEVIKPIFESKEVLSVLKMVDDVRLAVGNKNPLPSEVYELAVDDLTEIIKAGIRVGKMNVMKEAEMARAYINTEAGVMARGGGHRQVDGQGQGGGAGRNGEGTEMEAYYADLAKYQREKGALEQMIRDVSLGELLDAFMKVAPPRERSPQLWEYVSPEWMSGVEMKEWRKILTFCETFFGSVYRKREDNEPYGGYNNSPEQVGEKILNMISLPQKDFAFFYGHGLMKVRGVAHAVMRDLMEPKTITKDIYDRDGAKRSVTRTIFVFKEMADSSGESGGRYENKRVHLYASNEYLYKKDMVQRLVRNGVVANEEVAMMSLTLAMNMMEVGGVFSLADSKRGLGWESDAMRVIQKPKDKYASKLGEEIWGGPWTDYINAILGPNATKDQILAKAEELGILPELLAGSFFNQEITIESGGKMQLGEAIYNNIGIKFEEVSVAEDLGMESENTDADMYFGWRKDGIKAAADILGYITTVKGKELEFREFAEPDNVITKWRRSLYNAIRALRPEGNNYGSLLPTELIVAAIGGSTGLWPFAGPYLRFLGLGEEQMWTKYTRVLGEIVDSLGVSQIEAGEISKTFGVVQGRRGEPYRIDFANKLTDYKKSRNSSATEGTRRRARENLRKRRP